MGRMGSFEWSTSVGRINLGRINSERIKGSARSGGSGDAPCIEASGAVRSWQQKSSAWAYVGNGTWRPPPPEGTGRRGIPGVAARRDRGGFRRLTTDFMVQFTGDPA